MLRKSLLVLVLASFSVEARRIFTPLLLRRGPLNKPYTDISRSCPWQVNFWTGGYKRSATESFDCNGCEVPLSTLFFNTANFNAQEAFANNTAESKTNPLLATSILGPRVKYDESGALLGMDIQHCFGTCWRAGFRVVLPARRMRLRRCPSMGNGDSDLGGQTVGEFLSERTETVNGAQVRSFAYRLDFLSRLPLTCRPCPQCDIPLVKYADTNFPPNNPISISGQDITNQQGTPVSALKSADGSIPDETWAIPQEQAQALPTINADGSNVVERGRFDAEVDYTPLGDNTQNQSMLFIVPTVVDDALAQEAATIQAQVDELLACIDQEAEDVFTDCGISFKPQCISGIGDLATEFYAGYYFFPCLYGEVYAGLRWPTGKRSRNPLLVFRPSLGNNGHYEFKIGTQGIWKPCRWAALRGDITGFILTKNTECVASAFVNATVKNIGRPVRADIRWNYYILHVDMLVTPPNCYGFGGVIGYENYSKGQDKLRFCRSTALDCLGNEELLSARTITRNTRATSHKIRGEAFIETWEWLQIFGGGSTVFAGQNISKETEWHLGFNAYF